MEMLKYLSFLFPIIFAVYELTNFVIDQKIKKLQESKKGKNKKQLKPIEQKIGLLTTRKHNRTRNRIILTILSVILSPIIYFIIDKLEKDRYIFETLKKATEERVEDNYGKIDSLTVVDSVTVVMGFSEIKISKSLLINKEEYPLNKVLRINNSNNIKIRLVNDSIRVSAIVNSFDRKVVAEITDNYWRVNPGNYFVRNFDKYGIEVIDEYHVPILQVDFISRNTVKICGAFITPTSVDLIREEDVISFTKGLYIPEYQAYGKAIGTIFEYDQPDWFGKRRLQKYFPIFDTSYRNDVGYSQSFKPILIRSLGQRSKFIGK